MQAYNIMKNPFGKLLPTRQRHVLFSFCVEKFGWLMTYICTNFYNAVAA